MNEIVIKFIFLFMLGMTMINFAIAIAAKLKTKSKEFDQLIFYWLSLLGTYGTVVMLNKTPTHIGFAYFFQFIPAFLKTKFLRDSRGIESNWSKFLAAQFVGMATSAYLLLYSDLGFTLSLIPVTFSTTLPYWEPAWNSLVSHRHEANWIEKGLGIVFLTSIVNHFNYAFFRLDESTAWWGWSVSIAQYQCISIFLPLLINYRREMNERKNLEATLQKMSGQHTTYDVEISELYRTLELQVFQKEHLNRKLQKANNSLEEEREMNEILIRTVSHDLGNPLTVVNAYLDMMNAGRIPEQDRKMIWERIKTNTKSALDMISRIRDAIITRSQANIVAIHHVSLDHSIKRLVEQFESRLNEKNLRINYRTPSTSIFVAAEENTLTEHVFANILSNAIKFSPDGSEIQIKVTEQDGTVKVEFRDFGIGIDSYRLEKRLLHTTEGTRGETGSGFGVMVMGYFLRKFEGSYHIHSDGIGKGTTVSLSLKASFNHSRPAKGPEAFANLHH